MISASLTAVAALAGTAVGGLTSFVGSWMGQQAQVKSQLVVNDKSRRQELYRDFVNEASKFYVDSLMHDTPDLAKAVSLYALISRMRVISSPQVIAEGVKVLRSIEETYTQPNRAGGDILTCVSEDTCGPLQQFSETCRAELEALNY